MTFLEAAGQIRGKATIKWSAMSWGIDGPGGWRELGRFDRSSRISPDRTPWQRIIMPPLLLTLLANQYSPSYNYALGRLR